jgi:hypothetical protein
MVAWRCVPVAIFFGIAFGLDLLTGQRYSRVLGSAAIVGSVVSLFPAARPALVALGGYGAIWLGFNLVRAIADDAGLAMASQGTVASFEATVFGGTLPSAWLQARLHDAGRVQFHDVTLAMVHVSFFITPFVAAALLWWKHRSVFGRYWRATVVTFGLGLVGFLLLPTAPPWLVEPDAVTRVTVHALALPGGGGLPSPEDARLAFEPNHVAALPSVHVASAVLVFLAGRAVSSRLGIAGAVYAAAMTLAVVYLGEHYLIDAMLGWAVALAGWPLARRWRVTEAGAESPV